MPETTREIPTFNLWTEPWIGLECQDSGVEWLSIEQALLSAHHYKSLYEISPLVATGVHRLLVAILQFALAPNSQRELRDLRARGSFPEQKIKDFGKHYSQRFDLFSEKEPYLQSADLPLSPQKGDNIKSISDLLTDTSRTTAIELYRHGLTADEVFCPVCCAGGLASLPAFTSSGGAGLRPSINGVPPLYLIPGGSNLFESLTLSLITPDYSPISKVDDDRAWWLREPIVGRSQEISHVGYLHSLTFTPRRVRLHPERVSGNCTRCGRPLEWAVRTMIYDKGEYRPKEAAAWIDPFVAYRLPKKQGSGKPIPVRPAPGKALWREYAALFLQMKDYTKGQTTKRPAILESIADVYGSQMEPFAFRVVGLRTDSKAKVFEWFDSGFDIPPELLRSDNAGDTVQEGLDFASECEAVIRNIFQQMYGGPGRKADRLAASRQQMSQQYWESLAGPFKDLILQLAKEEDETTAKKTWGYTVAFAALEAIRQAGQSLPNKGKTLWMMMEAERRSAGILTKLRKEYLNETTD